MISFGWWCFQFVPSGGTGEHVVLGCFRAIWDWNIGQRWVEQRKQINIRNKSEDTSAKIKKSIASTEKDEKVL